MAKNTSTSILTVIAFAVVLGASALAQAGDLKFGNEALAVNDAGKITDAGKKAATNELKSEAGEEVWQVHLYAQIDNGGPGPLYVEFFGKTPDGKPYLTLRHEHSNYAGEKYISLSFEITGNQGFNKNKTYNVKVLQSSPKGKDIVFATQKLTLKYTEAEPDEDEGEDEGDEDEGDDDESDTVGADQDALDTLGGGDDGPPPVGPKKKGCSVHPEPTGLAVVMLLFAAGALGTRRRRR